MLEVRNLCVQFGSGKAALKAVDGLDLSLAAGEVVGLVGESGSGKSVASLAVMGLVDPPGRVSAERLNFAGHDLLTMQASARRKLLGRDIAMVFQDPAGSLNPCFTLGAQLMETLAAHEGGSRHALRIRALELLRQVEIPDAEQRLNAYPHQISGGMSQRVMIAMAIACNPRLLIADEPTTALDVTVQAQVLQLLLRLQRERDMALLLITHDLAVVAETAQRVIVMYAGQVMEMGEASVLFNAPRHPYTQALLDALPERNRGAKRLTSLPGVVPGRYDRPAGCLLAPRCRFATLRCHTEHPALLGEGPNRVRCHFPLNADGANSAQRSESET
ncbi:MAG: ATP-binding cassette domain-containing protein [Betaproteobacteria bacterium]|nr:ATP-binding cassette domain-containing protein [Betaproteobacteria bacterium]